MKHTILIILMLAFSAGGALWAQEADQPVEDATTEPTEELEQVEDEDPFMEEYTEPYVLEIGAHIGFAAGGINIETIPEGRKTNADFWAVPNYGATIYAPFGAESKLGGRLDIGVSTTGTRTRPYEFYDGESNFNGYIKERYTYFTVAPKINLSGVTFGVGFNFIMQGERWHPERDERHTIDKNLLKSMVMDLRLGGMIKAWQTETGTLYADIELRMMFSGIYEDNSYYYGMKVNPRGTPTPITQNEMKNLTPASIHIGIAYLFNLGL